MTEITNRNIALATKLTTATQTLADSNRRATHPLGKRKARLVVYNLLNALLLLGTLSNALRSERILGLGNCTVTLIVEVGTAAHKLDRWHSNLILAIGNDWCKDNSLVATERYLRDVNIHSHLNLAIIAAYLKVTNLAILGVE